jgi:hypothetical protein
MQLEAALQKRLAQLSLLEAENARLKQKESALQSCILGIEGSVAATRAVLEVEADPASAYGTPVPTCSGETNASSPAVSGDSSSGRAGSKGSGSSAAQVSSSVIVAVRFRGVVLRAKMLHAVFMQQFVSRRGAWWLLSDQQLLLHACRRNSNSMTSASA